MYKTFYIWRRFLVLTQANLLYFNSDTALAMVFIIRKIHLLNGGGFHSSLNRHMVTLVGLEPDIKRVKISYPLPLDDRAINESS